MLKGGGLMGKGGEEGDSGENRRSDPIRGK